VHHGAPGKEEAVKITIIVRDPSGVDDFRRAIERAGYAEDDFEVSAEDNSRSWGVGLNSITGTATVRNLRTDIGRVYKWGHGTTWWVAEFERDLIGGIFGV
jgi:hypothetical protein